MLSFFGAEAVDAILALYSHIINSPHRKAREYGLVKVADITDRGLRTSIHQAIRRIFSSRLETMTQDDGAMVISAAAPKSNWTTRTPTGCNERGKKPQQKGKPGWQELGGDYLHFTLYKENKDTMEVISYLARQLKMKPQAFQFAGTKDRRGITVQRVSVYRVIADRMVNAGRTLRNAKIGNYQYQQNGLRLGDLRGNEFVVTLRDCDFGFGPQSEGQADSASDIVKTAIENLRERGYINYYGLQRFGTFSTRTDAVGVKMLQGDFRAAVEAILDYSSTSLAAAQNPLSTDDKISVDDKARAHALHLFKTSGKVYPALQQLPKKFSAEASIIRHLGNPERSNDFLGALQAISRNLRLMYVHAYQSLVWNVVASERWKRFGNQVVDGDLVLVDEHGDKGQVTTVPEDLDVDGEIIVQPGENDRAGNADDIFARARALTADEVKSGKYSIFDIVLPTPGYDILYPANEIVDVYKDFMASTRGGNLDPHDMRRKWKDISLSGSYRKFLARPGQDISYEIRCYENENEQFVQTDLDRLFEANKQRKPIHPTQTIEASEEKGESGVESGESKKERQASKIAVILKLQLGASQYATMALRELMKADGLKTYKPDYGGGR